MEEWKQKRDDQIHASAVTFLIDGGEEKAATILLSCTLDYYDEEDYNRERIRNPRIYRHDQVPESDFTGKIITLAAPRASYRFLAPLNRGDFRSLEFRAGCSLDYQENVLALCDDILDAFSALLGQDVEIVVRASMVTINDQLREELLALLRGDHVTNQGLPFTPQRPVLTWNGLRFRSGGEVRIAEALERAQVLFLPNCMARLGFSHRENREADFLICHKRKWAS